MISVIIPTYNEAAYIQSTIKQLRQYDEGNYIKKNIVADGGSTDNTACVAKAELVRVVLSPKKGRAAQMNFGASFATQKLMYFLHADTSPQKGFTSDIANAIAKGYNAGCFMLSFDYNHRFLKVNCWFTRFDADAIRFGEQNLFVSKDIIKNSGGFAKMHIVLEDQELIKRLKKMTRFKIIKKALLTSARKYLENGIYETQGIFFIIYFMYRLGYSQQKLVDNYKKMIAKD